MSYMNTQLIIIFFIGNKNYAMKGIMRKSWMLAMACYSKIKRKLTFEKKTII